MYLSIHRSWINRIGTGLRKCSFSRPDRRVMTSPAASSRRRCFDPDAGHRHMGVELGQRAAVPFEEQVEQEATGRIGQRLEHGVVVHTRSLCNHIVTCQAHHADRVATVVLLSIRGW